MSSGQSHLIIEVRKLPKQSLYIYKVQLNRKSIYTVMLNEVKHPEEILREAQNDRCLQFLVQYAGFLYPFAV
jgi:hypothetical protein